MVEGMDRSTLPGPSVMTNICPMATSAKKVPKVSAAVSTPDGCLAAGEAATMASQTANAPT